MPYLDKHGIGVGGGSNRVEFPRITVSLTQPSNPKKYDLWVETNSYSGLQFLNQSEPISTEGDIKITKSDLQANIKGTVNKSGKTITHSYTAIPNEFNKIFETEYVEFLAKLNRAEQLTDGETKGLNAYYYTGSSWFQFSYEDAGVVGFDRNIPFVYDYNTGQVRKGSSISSNNERIEIFKIHQEEKVIYAYAPTARQITVLDFNLNIISQLTLSRNYNYLDIVYIPEKGQFALYRTLENYVYIEIFNSTTGAYVKTFPQKHGWNAYYIEYDNVYNRIYLSTYLNGNGNTVYAIDYDSGNTIASMGINWGNGSMAYSSDGQYIYLNVNENFWLDDVRNTRIFIQKIQRSNFSDAGKDWFLQNGGTYPEDKIDGMIIDKHENFYFLRFHNRNITQSNDSAAKFNGPPPLSWNSPSYTFNGFSLNYGYYVNGHVGCLTSTSKMCATFSHGGDNEYALLFIDETGYQMVTAASKGLNSVTNTVRTINGINMKGMIW